MQKQNITMTHNIGNKHTGKARERTVLSGKQCRDEMVGQGLELWREEHPTFCPSQVRCLKGASQHAEYL